MSTPLAGQNPKPPSAAAIVARPAPSFRSFQPQAEAGARRSWEDGRAHRPRRPGHRNQGLPPLSPGHLLPYRLRQRPRDRDEDPPAPAPGKTGPDASCTKGSAPWFAPRSPPHREPLPHHRPFRTRRRRIRARRHRPNRRPAGLHRFPAPQRKGSQPSWLTRPPAKRCARADQKSPFHGQQSSFTAPFKVVLAADVMSSKMRMFSFCSRPTEESSNRRDGNIILNIRNQQNTHGDQANSGLRIFFRAFASGYSLCVNCGDKSVSPQCL